MRTVQDEYYCCTNLGAKGWNPHLTLSQRQEMPFKPRSFEGLGLRARAFPKDQQASGLNAGMAMWANLHMMPLFGDTEYMAPYRMPYVHTVFSPLLPRALKPKPGNAEGPCPFRRCSWRCRRPGSLYNYKGWAPEGGLKA